MKRHLVCASCLFVFLFLVAGVVAAQAAGNGLEPGANVRIVKKDGNVFEGRVVKATDREFQINTTQGFKVNKYLKDIKKITDTGKQSTGGGISYRPVHDYVTVNDQILQGVYFGGLGMVFDLDLGTYGIQKGISIESLKSIEVISSGPGGTAEQECLVTCPHCGKPIRVKIGK